MTVELLPVVAFPGTASWTPTVVGLDISLTATGVASSRTWCTTAGRTGITRLNLTARIRAVDELADEICSLAGAPDLVVVEAPAFVRAAGGVLERDALWWLIVRRLNGRAPVALVAPSLRAKYATGKGTAGKAEVVDQVARRFPQYATRGDDNLCDAVVLAAMGADWLGHPIAAVPATHRAALDRVAWPEPYTLAERAGAVSD